LPPPFSFRAWVRARVRVEVGLRDRVRVGLRLRA